ncbi:TPA: hypothetical protein QEM76_005697 [Pseudomonas putida]|uniref:hypothetical protein n=1 Tax=Pseudomonas sp. 22515 TaxID=3453934 RepID=UPI003303AF0C|nr:hypothetical protein [Pseudomonas putida]HDS1808909.1 hypothetical protein [Pseudomonas putida]
MSTTSHTGYYASLVHAPAFADDATGKRQSECWERLVDDIHGSTTEHDLCVARAKADGFIFGLVEAGHLRPDSERDYVILSSIQRRKGFLRTLLSTLS